MSEGVPEGWEIVDFRDISIPKVKKSTLNDQHVPMTSSRKGLVLQSEYFNKQVTSADNTGYKIISNGDFTFRAMSDDGSFKFNRSKFAFDGIVSPAYEVFAARNCNAEFLSYILDGYEFSRKIYSGSQGGTRLALKYSTLSDVNVILPPLAEQKKIAAILTSVDEVIDATQKQIEKLQDLKKATMNELLTKGIGHTEFKDSELGRIPKSWEVRVVSDIAKIANGQVDPKLEPYASLPHIGSGNIVSWTGVILDVISAKEAGQISGKYQFFKGDILYSKVRPNLAKVCMPDFDGICSADIYPLKMSKGMHAEYVLEYLLTEKFTNLAIEVSERTGMPKINRQDLNVIKIPVPPFLEQQSIANSIKGIVHLIAIYTTKLAQTQSLKKSLMQDLLTGKVRVNVD